MALQKQKIPLSLDSGMDTKTDEFNSMSFKLVENLKYNKAPGLVKRPGSLELSRDTLTINSAQADITEGVNLLSSENSILLQDSTNTYHYASDVDRWKNISDNVNPYLNSYGPVCNKRERVLIANNIQSPSASFAETSDYIVSASMSEESVSGLSSSKLIIRVESKTEKNLVASKETAMVISESSKVIVNTLSDSCVYVFYTDNTGLYSVKITIDANTVTIGSETSIVVSVSGKFFDSISYGGNIYLCYNLSNTTLQVRKIDSTGVIASTSVTDATTARYEMINIVPYSAGFRFIYAYPDSTSSNPVRHFGLDTTLASTYSSAELIASGTERLWNVLAVSDLTKTYIFYTKTRISTLSGTFTTTPGNADGYANIYCKVILDSNNSVSTSETEVLSGQLLQFKPVLFGNNIIISSAKVLGECYTNGYSTLITHLINKTNLTRNMIAISAYLQYIVLYSGNSNQEPIFSNSTLKYPIIVNKSIVANEDFQQGHLFRDAATDLLEVTINFSTNNKSYISTGKGTYISGGMLKLYDGNSISEASFIDTPRIYGYLRGAAGVLPGGNYGFAVVAKWTDNNGNIHRSAPHIKVLSLTANFTHFLLIGGVFITDREQINDSNANAKVQIEIYQTELNGSVYYLQQILGNMKVNQQYKLEQTSDIKTDTEILYTLSGELENDVPTISNQVSIFNKRVWTVGTNVIQYSKLIEDGYPISWNDSLKIPIYTTFGDISGTCGMDNSLVIFTQNNINIVSGDGPNNLGENDNFTRPQPISSDTGCTEPNSIVATPEGIMFKGKKGIYMLNRGLYVSYIGAPVEFYNDREIISAKLIQNRNEVRFLIDNNKILCYDYFYKKWNVESYSDVVDFTTLNDTVYLLKSNGTVLKQSESLFQDGSSYYAGKFETNWITVGSINVNGSMQTTAQGFQRLYTINVLGKYRSAHNLKVSLAYNYSDTIVDYATIVPTGVGVYQFEVKPSLQKCEAFKIIVEDVSQAGTGESMVISHILLEVGIKGSAQKVLADSNRFAAT